MHPLLKMAGFVILMFFIVSSCKKSVKQQQQPVKYLDSGINGVRQWTGIKITPYMDSAGGAFLYDTTYWNFSMQITAYRDSEIYLYFDSTQEYSGNFISVPSYGLNTISFVYNPYHGFYKGYYQDDSISYNYVNDSIIWIETLYPGGEPPSFILAHTL